MNIQQQENWKFEAISQILIAFAKNKNLRQSLVFKGALILNKIIPTLRKSLDIDSNLAAEFITDHPNPADQKMFLKKHMEQAIYEHFESHDPVRFRLQRLKIDAKPHPRGWNGFLITISLDDNEKKEIRRLPKLQVDVAAPEELSRFSIMEMYIDEAKIRAYSLERIAGEKARAYLSTLPTYLAKIGRTRETSRIRDLYDLARIARERTISSGSFWEIAGKEFFLACKSRFVDCFGTSSFLEGWKEIEKNYKESPIIPKDVSFKEVTISIIKISEYWEKKGIIPFSFLLP